MPRYDVPPEIRDLADIRASARRARDWATADRVKDELAAMGWRVVDAGTLYSLERAAAPDVEEDGVVRYGAAVTVPSRLEEPATGTATVVILATAATGDVTGAVRAVRAGSPGIPVVVVAAGVTPETAAALSTLGDEAEVVWLATRQGHATALNAGIRRVATPVVLLLDAAVGVTGDLAGALVAALDDPTVAVAGPYGLLSANLRRFEPAGHDAVDVVAIDGAAMAFRRADFIARGPLDEHFETAASLDTWWSLVVRDFGEDDPEDAMPRRAVQAGRATVGRRGEPAVPPPGSNAARQAKRGFYRVLKRFATRRDLLVGGAGE